VDRFSYAACLRILSIARYHWRAIDGTCARAGIDPLDLDLSRFLHLVLNWTQDHVKPEDWDNVEREIFAPLPGVDPDYVPPSVIDEEMQLFQSFSRENKALGG
jgi:hypothetical protein